MLPPVSDPDLTGAWRGHYVQAGREHGISMRVAQRGQSLVGAMRDDETLWISHDTLVREGAEPVSHPVDVVTELPADSVLEGDVLGRAVSFVKRYRGTHTFTLLLGDQSVSASVEGHKVLYRGELDDSGRVLRGEWTIPTSDGEDGESGAFELRRD